ncbi:MAG TPA: energy transducer TonB [Planctomycetota bacterium]|nr:energy transducer TonB [Planctomycetota bacterium]
MKRRASPDSIETCSDVLGFSIVPPSRATASLLLLLLGACALDSSAVHRRDVTVEPRTDERALDGLAAPVSSLARAPDSAPRTDARPLAGLTSTSNDSLGATARTSPAAVASLTGPAKKTRTDNETTHSSKYAAARLVSGPSPEYPESSRRSGEGGTVHLRTCVARDGTVASVEVVTQSGFPALDDAAVKAVRSWTFEAATRDGQPIDSLLTHAVTFNLVGGSR